VAALKGKQKTRPAALNKSGRLIAPGFLTNAAANVAMALTVFIASSTARSTNPQVKETLMAESLSPAAQAVLDAYRSIWLDEPLECDVECLAAALRAAADQVVLMRPHGGRAWTVEQATAYDALTKAFDLLNAIAAELEALPND
jgi:hypothetical protein